MWTEMIRERGDGSGPRKKIARIHARERKEGRVCLGEKNKERSVGREEGSA